MTRGDGRVVSWVFFILLGEAGPGVGAQSGAIRGKVIGPDSKPMAGVTVQLRNDITGFRAETTTSNEGAFQFFNVPFNPYELHVQAQGFQTAHRTVEVRSAAPTQVDVDLNSATASETVNVTAETAAQLETDTSTSHVDIDKSYIARAPAPIASRAREARITATPGFAKDENGRF